MSPRRQIRSFVLALTTLAAGCTDARVRAPSDLPIDLSSAAPEVGRAVQTAQGAARANPRDGAAWVNLGMICEANGLPGAARQAYERAVEIDGMQARWWYRLALVNARLGDVAAAQSALDKVTSLDSRYAPAHWRRGLWLLDQGHLDQAEAAFRRAVETEPGDAAGWIGLARVALQRKDARQAVTLLEGLLSKAPGDRYALYLLGTAYRLLGQREDAEYALRVGLSGEPAFNDPWSDAVAEHRVGFAQELKAATELVLEGKFDAALPMLEKLRQQRPDDVALMNQVALAYLESGQVDRGLTLLQESLTRSPENIETHLRLVSAYLQVGDTVRAATHADRAVAINPSFGRAHEARGMVHWRTGRTEAALESFRNAVRYDPRNVEALVWMGSILNDRGERQQALARFEEALNQNPTLTNALIGVALVKMHGGEYEEAETALGRANILEPHNPNIAAAKSKLAALQATRRR